MLFLHIKGWFPLGVDCRRCVKQKMLRAAPANLRLMETSLNSFVLSDQKKSYEHPFEKFLVLSDPDLNQRCTALKADVRTTTPLKQQKLREIKF